VSLYTERFGKTIPPVAVTIDQAAELLGVSVEQVEAAARQVEPYRHQDGTPRWSLFELKIALGQPVKRRYKRHPNGTW
jgi:hypothetical protein